jgi:hypothetical protein
MLRSGGRVLPNPASTAQQSTERAGVLGSAYKEVGLSIALTVALGGAFIGCGSGGESSGRDSHADTVAEQHLTLVYRQANQAVEEGVTCSSDPRRRCPHPNHYPPSGVLQAEIGSVLLHRVIVDLARSTEATLKPGATYIVTGETSGRSITLAESTRQGDTWVLRGTKSRYSIEKRE